MEQGLDLVSDVSVMEMALRLDPSSEAHGNRAEVETWDRSRSGKSAAGSHLLCRSACQSDSRCHRNGVEKAETFCAMALTQARVLHQTHTTHAQELSPRGGGEANLGKGRDIRPILPELILPEACF